MDDVRAIAVMNGVTGHAARVATLPVGDSFASSITLGAPPDQPGTYPILLRINYRAASGQPLSAIRSAKLHTTAPLLEPEIAIETIATPLKRRSKLSVLLKNLSGQPRRGHASVHLGDEIRCASNRQPFQLAPGASARLGFELENVRARPGRHARILVFLTYGTDSAQRCAVHKGGVRIAGSAVMLFHRTRLWQAVIAMLALGFVAIQFFPRK